MDMYARASAEQAARTLLHLFRTQHPDRYSEATPIDELAAWSGLQVETFHPSDYPGGTFGFIDPDEDEDLIWMRRDLTEAQRRFTLAHELGHALLHCRGGERLHTLIERYASQIDQTELLTLRQDMTAPSRTDPCQEDDVRLDINEQEQTQDLGIGQSYDPRSQRELTANFFAAELLMPLDRVRALYQETRISTRELAMAFGVSNAAMLNRVINLLKPAAPAVVETIPTSGGKKQYDEFQQAAIEAPMPALIVAGPGSGKTSTLVGRVEHIVRNQGVPPANILALTFSRKAAQEMEERLHGLLSDLANGFPKVSTFHAFCADLLRKYGELVGLRPNFTLIDEVEGYFILRQQARRMRLHHYQSLSTPGMYFPDILKTISRAKDELVTPTQYAELARSMHEQAKDEETREKAEKTLEVAHVYALYEEELHHRGDTDFGGLIMQAVQLLREHPQARGEQQSQYQHILVDEFQDMNRASGVLLRELAGEQRGVWVVGDANQAIYGFRGASPANISQFAEDFTGAAILPLSRNYRSRPDLVALAESFRNDRLEPEQAPGKNRPVREALPGVNITLAQASDEEYELAGLLRDIRQKHDAGYAYRDMVVLCRKRAQVQRITAALAGEGLPVYEQGGMFEQEHIKGIVSIVLLLADPGGMGLLRAAHQPDHPLSQADIETLLLSAREQKVTPRALLFSGESSLAISAEGRRSLEYLANMLRSLTHASDVWSLLIQYLFDESGLVRLLLGEPTGQNKAIMNDLDSLLQLARRCDQQLQQRQQLRAQEASERGEPEPAPLTLEEMAKGFIEYLNLLRQLRQDGGSRQRAEDDEGVAADIIRVMTVHASKGLEFPVVYLPDLVKRCFPLDRRGSRVPTPSGMLSRESEGEAAHHTGESCLFYVGVTRAREQLVLSYSERKNGFTRSPYLDSLLKLVDPQSIQQQQWDAITIEQLLPVSSSQPSAAQPGSDFVKAMKPSQLTIEDIETFQRCPRQYAYGSIYHFGDEARDYRLFRQATQKTLEDLNRLIQDSADQPKQQEVQELYTQHWQALGGPASPFAAMYEEHGHEVVEIVRRQLIATQETQWNMRHRLEIDIAGRQIRVTIDRIEQSSQSEPVKFVRARFSKSKKQPDPDMRDLFYTLAYRQHFAGQEVEIYSHNLSKNEMVPRKLSARIEKNRHEKAVRLIEEMEHEHYPARPEKSDTCQSCPFYWICPT